MNRQAIVDALIEKLSEEFAAVQASAAAAREGATHEDSKPENEYDTRGLEQSYLAGAQAARAAQLDAAVAALKTMTLRSFGEGDPAQITALVAIDNEEGERDHIFLSPVGGGTTLIVEGTSVRVVTKASPMGKAIIGKRAGDFFEIQVRGEVRGYEMVSIS